MTCPIARRIAKKYNINPQVLIQRCNKQRYAEALAEYEKELTQCLTSTTTQS